jgi:Mg-chelatase subunit ChlD
VICATALVLLLDASGSVSDANWQLQADGHAAAFEADAITRVIEREPVAVIAYGFSDAPERMVPWRVIRTAADAASFAAELRQAPRPWAGGTNIGSAIMAGVRAFNDTPCAAESRVIDLVTDGEAAETPARNARDQAELAGVKINALGVGNETAAAWLREHAVTLGGFVMHAETWADFARAVLRKINAEIAGIGGADTDG